MRAKSLCCRRFLHRYTLGTVGLHIRAYTAAVPVAGIFFPGAYLLPAARSCHSINLSSTPWGTPLDRERWGRVEGGPALAMAQ
jgi:hypothetical protein